MTTQTHTPTAGEIAQTWAETMASRDWDALGKLVSHDVSFREATPRGTVELDGREAMLDYARAGLGGAETLAAKGFDGELIGDSVRVTMCLLAGSDGQTFAYDQTLYLTLDADSRACTISAACSGGQPV